MTSDELKTRRAALGMSQDQLARALGVTTSTVSRWEQGALTIGNPEMLRLALEALGRDRVQQLSVVHEKAVTSKKAVSSKKKGGKR